MSCRRTHRSNPSMRVRRALDVAPNGGFAVGGAARSGPARTHRWLARRSGICAIGRPPADRPSGIRTAAFHADPIARALHGDLAHRRGPGDRDLHGGRTPSRPTSPTSTTSGPASTFRHIRTARTAADPPSQPKPQPTHPADQNRSRPTRLTRTAADPPGRGHVNSDWLHWDGLIRPQPKPHAFRETRRR